MVARLETYCKGGKEEEVVLESFNRYQKGLSVVLSNLGIASRYLGDVKGVIAYCHESLANWPGQETATDNLEELQSVPVPAESGKLEK
jgi:hypothetical protein